MPTSSPSSGTSLRELECGGDDLDRGLRGEDDAAAEERVARVEGELDGRDDAEQSAAAAQRPDEVGVVGVGDAAELARGIDELDRDDRTRRQAVSAAEHRLTAVQGEADDVHLGIRPREGDPAGAVEALERATPVDAGPDAEQRRLDVDDDLVEPRRTDEDHPGEVAEGAVAVRLGRDAVATVARGTQDRLHVGDVGRRGDRDGALVDGEVPRHASRVVVGVVCEHERALQFGTESVEHGAVCRVGHRHPFRSVAYGSAHRRRREEAPWSARLRPRSSCRRRAKLAW